MNVAGKTSEYDLLSAVSEGSKAAFSELYDRYSGAIYGVVLRIAKEEKVAQDVMQDAFIKIWQKAGEYDSKKGSPFTWMMNIARNRAIDIVRSGNYKAARENRNESTIVNQMDRSGGEELNVDTIGLKEVLNDLKPELKEIIDHLYFGGMTQQETSEKLGIPLGTVKTRTRAALSELRIRLKATQIER